MVMRISGRRRASYQVLSTDTQLQQRRDLGDTKHIQHPTHTDMHLHIHARLTWTPLSGCIDPALLEVGPLSHSSNLA
jgi:hypothetical protein